MSERIDPDDPGGVIDASRAAPGPLFPESDAESASNPSAAATQAAVADSDAGRATNPSAAAAPTQAVPPTPFVDELPAGWPALPASQVNPAFAGPAFDLSSVLADPYPPPGGPTRAALATDVVTCPECGQWATVDMARRQADDFCKRCDFPLFWASGTVIAPDGEESGASLRRLPGTVGRAATAALICPHCSEPNSPAALICIRCALSLRPVEIPEPEPVQIAAPEPEPEPEPVRGFDWWWIVAIVTVVIALALVAGLVYLK